LNNEPLKDKKFPNFALLDHNGVVKSMADFKKFWTVFFMYISDKSSNCSQEIISFSELSETFREYGARVVGVSPDSNMIHNEFVSHHDLSLTLLGDPNHRLLEATWSFGKKLMYGQYLDGVLRSTFLVDPKGNIRDIWRNVKVSGHAQQVLERFLELISQERIGKKT
jgi:peroxiredoxin Q/BCP